MAYTPKKFLLTSLAMSAMRTTAFITGPVEAHRTLRKAEDTRNDELLLKKAEEKRKRKLEKNKKGKT